MKKILLVLSVCLLAIGQVWGQSQTISGTVRNAADDEPVIGASVQVKGTSRGTITDVDGKFAIEAEPDAILVVSFIGMGILLMVQRLRLMMSPIILPQVIIMT